MLSTLWKVLGQHTLCGAAVLVAANLVQAQGTSLPAIPQPAMLPALTQDAPKGQSIQPVQLKDLDRPQLGGPAANAIKPAVPAPTTDSDKARIDQLERKIQELTDAMKATQGRPFVSQTPVEATQPGGLTAKDVQQLINGYFADKDAQEKAAAKAKADEGYKVGTDLKIGASWQNGVVFETPNKDFWMRAGFRFQWDNVWWNQSTANKLPPPKGIGPELDGDYWRRIRPNFSGGFWEVGEFNVEVKLENIQNGIVGMDDVWVGVKDIPFIGTVRLGHFHLPHGLEADMYSSSKPMTFFEVSSANNAFYGGERCGSGIWLTNAYMDQRTTYAAAFYRPENADNGVQFQNGDYAAILRLTGLPYWQNERCFLHLGGSVTWRHAQNHVVAFSTDAEMRDKSGGDNGYGAPLTVATTTVAAPPIAGTKLTSTSTVSGVKPAPGNSNTWVTTGNITADSSKVFGTELWYNNGPFSIQAEYLWSFIDDAIVGGKSQGNLGFTGGYIQAGYFLTGESRQYDKRFGRLNSEYIARANTPFWLVRGDDGRFNYGLGAWELAARFSRIDLNDGPIGKTGIPLINGGILDQWEAGVNWHLNNNLRIQFMYLHAQRYDSAAYPSSWANGFGIRTQLTF
jgi:phosphate-selective porin OprO and OprP